MKSFFSYGLILLCIFAVLSLDVSAWWNSTFDYRVNLTINHSKIDSQLTNFPVFVKLNGSNFNFSEARGDGYDLRFIDSDGTTLLDFHRIRHDSEEGNAEYWVSIPDISSTSETTFFMYYGNLDASDGSSSTSIWDDDYVGVFHMDDATSTTTLDSSSRDNHGTKRGVNQPAETSDGKSGLAQSYAPSDHYISVGTSGMTNARGTVSLWVNVDEITGDVDYRFFGHNGPLGGFNNRLFIGCSDTNETNCRLYVGLGGGNVGVNNFDLVTEKWYNIVLVYDGVSYEIFVNGASIASDKYYTFNRINTYLDIGNSGAPNSRTYSPSAVIDEVRISKIVRSESWILASYHSENNSLIEWSETDVVDKPFFPEINLNSETFLNPGSQQTVLCNGTVDHVDGFSLINTVSAYLYHESFSPSDPMNRTYIYQDNDCKTIDTEINGWFECSFEVYFFAMPGNWSCEISSTDNRGATGNAIRTTYIEELISIDVDSNLIDFGLQVPGTDSGTTDYPNEIYNRGNVPLDINIRTFDNDENPDGAMSCSIGTIPFENIRFGTSSGTPVSEKSFAPVESVDVNIGLLPQQGATATLPTSFMFYWGFIIPQNIAGTCNGHIRYTAFIAE